MYAAIALMLAATLAQDAQWHQISDGMNETMAIDVASIQVDGAARRFDAKLTSTVDPREMRMTVRAHCDANTVDVEYAETFVDGVQQPDAGLPPRPFTKNVAGFAPAEAMYAFVCREK